MSSGGKKKSNRGSCIFLLIAVIIAVGAYPATKAILEFRDRDRHAILNLDLNAEAKANCGRPYVTIQTNLPDGTVFAVSFRSKESSTALDSDTVTIKDGTAQSKEFVRDDNDSYPDGEYRIRLEAAEKRQPSKVMEVLGDGYKYVKGTDVGEDKYDTNNPGLIYKNLSLKITDSDTTNQELEIPDPFSSFTDTTENTVNNSNTNSRRYTSLNGRGISDAGRSEPAYVGVTGYVVVYGTYDFYKSDTCLTTPWAVPTYDESGNQIGTVEHKTEVIVRKQNLEHEGWGRYSGYLLVEKTDNHSQFYINVSNFITKPYWTYTDINEAEKVGYFIAEYHQKSSYRPVGNEGDTVDIADGTKVLVIGKAGMSRNINMSETDIEAVVWKQWQLGYGGVSCYFNHNDLTLVY